MKIWVDVLNAEDFVTSDKFTNFVLANTTEFGTAAFIIQTLLDKIKELKSVEA